MKKWLIVFAIIDFCFIALVLKLLSNANHRNIASTTDNTKNIENFTDGQKRKLQIVKSIEFSTTAEKFEIKTDFLQALCASATLIEVQYAALNVAYAGGAPTISHLFSCNSILSEPNKNTLETNLNDFTSLHAQSKIDLTSSQMLGSHIYSDEDFPTEWRLSAIVVTGESNFTITTAELDFTHGEQKFLIPTSIFAK